MQEMHISRCRRQFAHAVLIGLLAVPAAAAQQMTGAPILLAQAAPVGGVSVEIDPQIWVAVNSQQTGPFEPPVIVQKIMAGEIKADTLVFGASMQNWTKAGEVPALKAILAQVAGGPTPPTPNPPVQPPVTGGTEVADLPPGVNAETLKASAAIERQDFGVAPISTLHQGAPHAPTPTSIPGGKIIDTLGLASLLNHKPQVPVLLLDALGGNTRLPNAYNVAWAANGTSLDDQVQQQFSQGIQQTTNGARDVPVVVYCADPHCWLSYNVALRAIHLGYSNVFWYRGGIGAWEQAGLPTQPQQTQ